MEIEIGAKRTGGIWHGFVKGWKLLDDGSLRALTEEIAVGKAERAARAIAEREGFLGILKIVRRSQ
jgi:hypothetical protein